MERKSTSSLKSYCPQMNTDYSICNNRVYSACGSGLFMHIIAHRGASGGQHSRENTLDAFADAVALGADGIETDVRKCADGELVLMHDPHTACGRPVRTLELAELRSLTGVAVPRVGEALSTWPGILWNLELKEADLAGPLIELLAGEFGEIEILVSSFWHAAITAHRWPAGTRRALLLKHRIDFEREWLERVRRAGACEGLVWHLEYADRECVDRAAALGLTNYAYAVRIDADLERACSLGLDGLIVDDLERALARRQQ